jgi:hypothetical protein
MTTRELAEKIARAILRSVDSDEAHLAPHDSYFNPQWEKEWGNRNDLAVDVLSVLHEHDAWFCRWTEDARGVTVETSYERVGLPFS